MKYLYRTEMLVFRHQQHFPWLPLYFSTLLCTFSLKRLTAPRDVNGPSHLVFHGVAKISIIPSGSGAGIAGGAACLKGSLAEEVRIPERDISSTGPWRIRLQASDS
jgi:hypothetical protein